MTRRRGLRPASDLPIEDNGLLHRESFRYATRRRLTHFPAGRPPVWWRIPKEKVMNKLILASVSAVALLGVAACSDTDDTTTQSTTDPAATEEPATTTTDPATPPPPDTTAPAN